MKQLVDITEREDIFPEYRHTPIGLLLEYHNLNKPFDTYSQAQLLTGMCMDNRKHLHIPDNFSYIIRSGGANLRYSELKLLSASNYPFTQAGLFFSKYCILLRIILHLFNR